MAKHNVRPLKPVDHVGYEPVMLGVSKARAMAWVLEQLGQADGAGNSLLHALEDTGAPEETRGWLHTVVADALYVAPDDIEREYRKLGTNLLAKETAQAEVERLLRSDPTPKDGA